jgi:uncharacterized OB-fold protein
MKWDWDDLPGTGTVFAYTWADQRPVADSSIYNISIIQLDGTTGQPVRLMTRVVDVDKASLRIGLPVGVTFEAVDDQVAIPFFKPQPDAGTESSV